MNCSNQTMGISVNFIENINLFQEDIFQLIIKFFM